MTPPRRVELEGDDAAEGGQAGPTPTPTLACPLCGEPFDPSAARPRVGGKKPCACGGPRLPAPPRRRRRVPGEGA